MRLLNSYDDRDIAEIALSKLNETKRLASERDGTKTIFNLFGTPSWKSFYLLELFQLRELEQLLKSRASWSSADLKRHKEITTTLHYISNQFELKIPSPWL